MIKAKPSNMLIYKYEDSGEYITMPLIIMLGIIKGKSIKEMRFVLLLKYPSIHPVKRDIAEICTKSIKRLNRFSII